jgi:MFS family permease
MTVFMLYAVRELHLGPGLIGLVFSAIGLGGLLGAVLANRIVRRFPLGRSYVVARAISSVGPVCSRSRADRPRP